jgi:hypothetical protein
VGGEGLGRHETGLASHESCCISSGGDSFYPVAGWVPPAATELQDYSSVRETKKGVNFLIWSKVCTDGMYNVVSL